MEPLQAASLTLVHHAASAFHCSLSLEAILALDLVPDRSARSARAWSLQVQVLHRSARPTPLQPCSCACLTSQGEPALNLSRPTPSTLDPTLDPLIPNP